MRGSSAFDRMTPFWCDWRKRAIQAALDIDPDVSSSLSVRRFFTAAIVSEAVSLVFQ